MTQARAVKTGWALAGSKLLDLLHHIAHLRLKQPETQQITLDGKTLLNQSHGWNPGVSRAACPFGGSGGGGYISLSCRLLKELTSWGPGTEIPVYLLTRSWESFPDFRKDILPLASGHLPPLPRPVTEAESPSLSHAPSLLYLLSGTQHGKVLHF